MHYMYTLAMEWLSTATLPIFNLTGVQEHWKPAGHCSPGKSPRVFLRQCTSSVITTTGCLNMSCIFTFIVPSPVPPSCVPISQVQQPRGSHCKCTSEGRDKGAGLSDKSDL